MLVETMHGVAIVALDVQVKSSMRQFVADKVERCECLQCEQPADPKRRGCCAYHYGHFRQSLYELPLAERPSHEARCIKDGKILSSRPGRRVDVINNFRSPRN
jgi:hypothetical protein